MKFHLRVKEKWNTVVHKHELRELTMTRTLSKESGLFEYIAFCLSGMLATVLYMNILTAVTKEL